MKLFKTSDIAILDKYTIDNEPIADIDLMERASITVVDYIVNETSYSGRVSIFCGPGNNGGDGLAVARLLANIENRFTVQVFILNFGKKLIGSSAINLNRLATQGKVDIHYLNNEIKLPALPDDSLIIDALFGSGLNRPLNGYPKTIVTHINESNCQVLSIDIPSGLMGEDNDANDYSAIVKAQNTITFQFPKISFLFPENEAYVGQWVVTDIGLHPAAIEHTASNYYFNSDQSINHLLKKRSKFAHKGHFGHALLIAGAYGKMGAAVLASKACLRSGVGLLTTHIPHSGFQIIQTSVPEAMTSIDESDIIFTKVENIDQFNAIGIGPGLGTKVNTHRGLKKLLETVNSPMVLDADAINILGKNKDWLSLLPRESILTPHPKEFERIGGNSKTSYQRLQKAISLAQQYQLNIVLKGAYTAIINSQGKVWFNSTGNPGMATAGSGDALTGIILALLAQNYSAVEAARIGVYIHGLAGDIAAARRGYEALIASDIIENLGEAFKLAHK